MKAGEQTKGLEYERLDSWAYVESYLRQFGPLDPSALMDVGWCALAVFEAGGPLAAQQALELPYALGWAHALGWLPDRGLDERLSRVGCEDNVVTMRWEAGRCEALEQGCSASKKG